jgi:hypothetical protein
MTPPLPHLLPISGGAVSSSWPVTGSTAPAAAGTAIAALNAAAQQQQHASLRQQVQQHLLPLQQQQHVQQSLAGHRLGFVATARSIYAAEGAAGFTRGIQASAARAVCNGGIRLGMYGACFTYTAPLMVGQHACIHMMHVRWLFHYTPFTTCYYTHPHQYNPQFCTSHAVTISCADPIKRILSPDGSGSDLHMGLKLAAGSASGGIGAVLTTPVRGCTCPHLAHMLLLHACSCLVVCVCVCVCVRAHTYSHTHVHIHTTIPKGFSILLTHMHCFCFSSTLPLPRRMIAMAIPAPPVLLLLLLHTNTKPD